MASLIGLTARSDLSHFPYPPTLTEGPEGTKALTSLQEEGLGVSGKPWPTTPYEFVTEQDLDPNLSVSLSLLSDTTNDNIIQLPTRLGQTDIGKDYIFRRVLLDGTLGPLTRRTTKFFTHEHERTQYSVEKEVLQTLIPENLIKDCLVFHHENMGHLGRNRTLARLTLNKSFIGIQ